MLIPKKIRLARQAYPLIQSFVALLEQLMLVQFNRDERCLDSEGDYACVLRLIQAYGVKVSSDFTYPQLVAILNALDTVGTQIMQCFTQQTVETTPTATPSIGDELTQQQAFQSVFIPMEFFIDPNKRSAATSYDATNNVIRITLGAGTFEYCRREYVNAPDKAYLPHPVRAAPCDSGEFKEINRDGVELTYRWERGGSYQDRTVEGVIRHEIGHGLLNLLMDSYGQEGINFKEEFSKLVGPNTPWQEILKEIPDDPNDFNRKTRMRQHYFPNVTELTNNYDDETQLWTEDFADAFAMMGRFLIGESGFADERDRLLLQQTTRYQVFESHLCCWIAQITGLPELCQETIETTPTPSPTPVP